MRVEQPPTQRVADGGFTFTTGTGFTNTVAVATLVHPWALVPDIVYTVLTSGATVTGLFIMPPGMNVWVATPEMVIIVLSPAQTVVVAGLATTVGFGFTTMLTVRVVLQPAAEAPVTVNTVDTAGQT